MSPAEPHNPTPEAAPLPPTDYLPAAASPAVAFGRPQDQPGPPPAEPEAVEAAPAQAGAAAPTEQVGRGLLFSLGSIVVGVALTLVLWQLGFIASITSFALAFAAIWLYTKGAGHPPVQGAMGVVAVIVVAVALSLVSVVAADALSFLAQEYPEASLAEKFDFVVSNLVRVELWREYTTDALMYLLFAALGTFGLIRQLGRAKGA